jgi:hypothetical protein
MVQQTLSLLDFLTCASPQTSQASKQAYRKRKAEKSTLEHDRTHSANQNSAFQRSISHKLSHSKVHSNHSGSIQLISMLYMEHTNEAFNKRWTKQNIALLVCST